MAARLERASNKSDRCELINLSSVEITNISKLSVGEEYTVCTNSLEFFNRFARCIRLLLAFIFDGFRFRMSKSARMSDQLNFNVEREKEVKPEIVRGSGSFVPS